MATSSNSNKDNNDKWRVAKTLLTSINPLTKFHHLEGEIVDRSHFADDATFDRMKEAGAIEPYYGKEDVGSKEGGDANLTGLVLPTTDGLGSATEAVGLAGKAEADPSKPGAGNPPATTAANAASNNSSSNSNK